MARMLVLRQLSFPSRLIEKSVFPTGAGLRCYAQVATPVAWQQHAPPPATLEISSASRNFFVQAAPGPHVALVRPYAARSASSKPPRDPERPKRPSSPWIRYLNHCRQQSPDMKGIMSDAAKQWKAMSDGDKAPFVKPYEVDKAAYEKAFAAYKESGKLAAWKRDPEKPLKPLTAFMLYAKEVRQENPSLKLTEQTKLAGEKWKAMTPPQKQPYEDKASASAKKYKEEMEKYKASGKADVWRDKVGLSKTDTKKAQEAKKAAEQNEKAKQAKEKIKAKEALDKQKKRELQARIRAKQKERQAKMKSKEKEEVAKEQERAKKAKEKEMQAKQKEKAKEMQAKQKMKEMQAKQKLKEKEQAANEKERAKRAKEKAMHASQKAKAKEMQAKQKAKPKEQALKAKAKLAAKRK